MDVVVPQCCFQELEAVLALPQLGTETHLDGLLPEASKLLQGMGKEG